MFKIFICCASIAYSVAAQNYCDLTCDIKGVIYQNTVCDRQNVQCAAGPSCVGFQEHSLNDELNRYVVHIHNNLRLKVALGNEKRGNQPPAANMRVLRHNDELKYGAQCWTNNCVFQHDKCRRTPKYKDVGQNLAKFSTTFATTNITQAIYAIINGWYDEVQLFDSSRVNQLGEIDTGPQIGHYSQVVWAKTKEVGCGLTSYKEGSETVFIFGCNYGPSGNWASESMYEIGSPASRCPHGPSNKYPGLCL